MKSDATGALSFEYGNIGPPLPLDPLNPQVPSANANTPTKVGNADSGSYNVASGVITITISNSKIENLIAGNTLFALNARTFLARPDAGQKSQNNASDITADGAYTLVGNASCQGVSSLQPAYDDRKSDSIAVVTSGGGNQSGKSPAAVSSNSALSRVTDRVDLTIAPRSILSRIVSAVALSGYLFAPI